MGKTRKESDAVIQKRSYEELIKRGNSKEQEVFKDTKSVESKGFGD